MPRRRTISATLLTAIRKGKINVVRVFIDLYGLSYIQAWLEGYMLLCDALNHKKEEIAKLFVERGAKVNFDIGRLYFTPLHYAVTYCGIEIVRMLLDKGADVNGKNQYGRTPLYNAIEYKKIEITELLLANRADFNDRDNNNISPLDLATKKNHLKIMKSLLNHGAFVNCEDSIPGRKRLSPLHFAAKNYDEKIVTLLLQYGANINIRGENNMTPLHFAVEIGCEKAVLFFLNKGADIDAHANENITPLQVAVINGHESVTSLLLRCGANVDDVNDLERTALYEAVERGYVTIVREILNYFPDIDNDVNRKSLNAAVLGSEENYKKIVEALSTYGLKIIPPVGNNYNLMHAAVTKGYFEIVKDILNYGANLHLIHSSTDGSTLLHTAVQMKQEEVSKLLMLFGANTNNRDSAGKTPIFYAIDNVDVRMTKILLMNRANVIRYPELLSNAVKKNSTAIVDTLLHHDIDINHADHFKRTALHFTLLREAELNFATLRAEKLYINIKAEMAQQLLRKGANVNAETVEGATALHVAVVKKSPEMVKILLEHNANVNCQMVDGTTPLHVAAKKGFQEITEILLKFGADINFKNNFGKSALYISTQKNNEDVTRTLLEYGADFIKMFDREASVLRSPVPFIDEIDSSSDESVESVEFDGDHSDEDSDSSHDDFTFPPYFGTVNEEIFKHHLIKLKAAHLCLNIPLVRYTEFSGTNNFKVECTNEITNMKLEKIDAKNSFYDILRKSITSLVKYMNNENTIQILEAEDYKTRFPIYAGMIKSKFIRLMYRRELETKAISNFHSLCNITPELPYDCTEKIINCLDEKSIKFLNEASSLP